MNKLELTLETVCLAHSEDGKPNGCQSSEKCIMHTKIRKIGNKETLAYNRFCGDIESPIFELVGDK